MRKETYHGVNNSLLRSSLVAAAIAGLAVGSQGASGGADEPIALIVWVEGEVTVSSADDPEPQRASLFDLLAEGTLVRTGDDAELVIVFVDGRRYALGPGARGSLAAEGLRAQTGRVQRLSPVPALAALPKLALEEPSERRPGAGRIRLAGEGAPLVALEPPDGATVLVDETVLRFEPVPSVEHYEVEISDLGGEPVFSADTDAMRPRIEVPEGLLLRGSVYHWRVRSRATGRAITYGDALFATLDADGEEQRRQLRSRAHRDGDSGLRLLLAAVDYDLGLSREACAGLADVARRHPQHEAIAQARARLACTGQR